MPINSGTTDHDAGVTHEVPADVSEYVISEFFPGRDRCLITLNHEGAAWHTHVTQAGVLVAISDGPDLLKVLFSGLDDLPIPDIWMRVGSTANPVRPFADLGPLKIPNPVGILPDNGLAEELLDDDIADAASAAGFFPEFAEFDVDRECIEIWVPAFAELGSVLEVVPSTDRRDGIVLVNGRIAAVLKDAPNASEKNVKLMAVGVSVSE